LIKRIPSFLGAVAFRGMQSEPRLRVTVSRSSPRQNPSSSPLNLTAPLLNPEFNQERARTAAGGAKHVGKPLRRVCTGRFHAHAFGQPTRSRSGRPITRSTVSGFLHRSCWPLLQRKYLSMKKIYPFWEKVSMGNYRRENTAYNPFTYRPFLNKINVGREEKNELAWEEQNERIRKTNCRHMRQGIV
jgi:hypothetical protein